MKRRLIPAVTLIALAISGTAASAAGSAPVTGTWSGKVAGTGENVRFQVVKTRKGYRARSTRLYVIATCSSGAPNAVPTTQPMSTSGVTVTLKKSGKRLVGVRNIDDTDRGGSETYGIRITFTSARQATVVLAVSDSSSMYNDDGTMDFCKGRITLTAKPSPK